MRTLQRRFALIRRYVLGVLLLVPLFFAPGAQPQAAVVNFDGFGVTSIDGLVVGAQTYDIAFVEGIYTAVFPGDITFPNAEDIAITINAELNVFSPAPIISTLIVTISDEYHIPLSINTDISTRGGVLVDVDLDGMVAAYSFEWLLQASTVDFSDGSATWAVPTLSAVPLPAALPLFGSALAMLGIVGWRRKRRAAA